MWFYSSEKDEIQTAPFDRVLLGSTAKQLLAIAKAKAIHVHSEAPNIKSISAWKGAFLTSASRHVLPIASIILNDKV